MNHDANIKATGTKVAATKTVSSIRAAGKPVLTLERYKKDLRYDPTSGEHIAVRAIGGRSKGKSAGTLSNGYRQIFIGYWAYRSNRLAWLAMKGKFPPKGYFVDHINGNRADDRWSNLRLATPQQNARNRRPCKRNKSGKVGVCVGSKPNTWQAHITVDDKTTVFKCREVLEDAIADRCEAEKHYFGDFAAKVSELADG